MGVCRLIKTGVFALGPLFVLISVAVLFGCGAAFAASPNPPLTHRQSLRSYIGESANHLIWGQSGAQFASLKFRELENRNSAGFVGIRL